MGLLNQLAKENSGSKGSAGLVSEVKQTYSENKRFVTKRVTFEINSLYRSTD